MNHNISEAVRCAKHSEHYDIMYLAQAVGDVLEAWTNPELELYWERVARIKEEMIKVAHEENKLLKEALAQPEQEPVCIGWDTKTDTPIFITPPQRKPLTDEELFKLWDEDVSWMKPGTFTQFKHTARAIEAAHGIKENS